MKTLYSALLASLVLTGCDDLQVLTDAGGQFPPLSIYPATEVQISETKTAYIAGHESCPLQSEAVLMKAAAMKLLPEGCITIGTDTKQVRVVMQIEEQVMVETWKVGRYDNGLITLTRPNGFEVREPSQTK